MAKIIEFEDDRCIIIRIREKSVCIRGSLYEAVRRCWRTNLQKAQKSDYVLVLIGNNLEVKGVFKPECWYYLDDDFCQKTEQECKNEYGVNTELCAKDKRIAFVGKELEDDVKYLHKLTPDGFFQERNPFEYTY